MRVIMVMYDSLNRRYLSPYGCESVKTPNFDRLAAHTAVFDNCYIGSMPCMPARRELHTGRHNFMHRSWGPIEPYDDSMPEMLKKADIPSHLTSDHQHYWEDGGCTYHTRYSSWENSRGQEGDTWKCQMKDPDMSKMKERSSKSTKEHMKKMGLPDMERQDAVNRTYLSNEADMPQAVTFRRGLEFLEKNHDADNWFLQIETFDPHEPFFASERFKNMYQDPDYDGKEFDWPSYGRVKESPEEVDRCINNYKALISMCDYYLGTVLEAMDKYDMWDDTMLIVNTDHGFLLGEHGWWAKSVMPHYNEIANIPMFIWDPRSKVMGRHRKALVQNIDIAPTVLRFLGQEPTEDMCGQDLRETIESDKPVREYAAFGTHGEHFDITDGRYVYMRSPKIDAPLFEYTLMPTHMRNRFSVNELRTATMAERPFSFTKGIRPMKIESKDLTFGLPARFGEPLYDLSVDPHQMNPIEDPEVELRLTNEIRNIMLKNDAPDEYFSMYGLSREKEMTMEELLEQKAAWKTLTFPGYDGYVDVQAYSALKQLSMYMPEGYLSRILAGLKATADAMGKNHADAEAMTAFVNAMPIPDDQKQQFLAIL